ncbi:Apulose-4-phosphate transketolase subunit A [uncultured bacterium]|nr:Apulose-4-phosphate transketolase subunit A [uncultured bacterium]
MNGIDLLARKALWVKQETVKLHKLAPGTRIASSLSCIEILVALYYGKILSFNSNNTRWETRDRFIVSKAHGSVSLYPILADFGFFEKEELKKIGKEGAILGDIPDNSIPGFETINGSLGHGLGVACGVALALKKKKLAARVFVLSGDGELYEGSVWESIMFASHHRLNNLILIIDNNKICMLDYCKNILDLEPLDDKFRTFNWATKTVDGHNIEQLCHTLTELKRDDSNLPKVLIADTIKGKGVPRLENDSLCHIKALKEDEIERIIRELP